MLTNSPFLFPLTDSEVVMDRMDGKDLPIDASSVVVILPTMAETIGVKAQPGPQSDFLSSSADAVFYGGAAGGGMEAVVQLITGDEQLRLELFELRIERGLGVFNDVGESLAAIRDEGLYRGTHGTFEDYCIERWGVARRTAYQLIGASVVARNVRNCAQIEPANESQARPLTGLQPEIQRQVWAKAVATAPEGKVTAAHVERTVAQLHGVASHRAERAKQILDDDGDIPTTVTLRVARVVYLMTLGNWMHIESKDGEPGIAELTGLTENGAWRMLDRLSGGHHVPITEMDGKWGILSVSAGEMPY